MNKIELIQGFYKLSKENKINWLIENYLNDIDNKSNYKDIILKYWNQDSKIQLLHDNLTENVITNFYINFSLAPNFIIDNRYYVIPMATEESSVVAAACNGAKFWYNKGGFKTKIISTIKKGSIYILFQGRSEKINIFYESIREKLIFKNYAISKEMEKRGGGILNINLIKLKLENIYKINIEFNTCDSMGANFINSYLEGVSKIFIQEIQNTNILNEEDKKHTEIIMSILSNYNDKCLVESLVSCDISELKFKSISTNKYIKKFKTAVEIAKYDVDRACTHNKGIMNGIDAVAIATGNDFRSIEACAHTYASRTGLYSSLSECEINSNIFTFKLKIPLSLGVIGGVTNIHPLSKLSLKILKNPNAEKLMSIMASCGLAQNFSAINSLITEGIQTGHMRMHLENILYQLDMTKNEKKYIRTLMLNKNIKISTHKVKEYLEQYRNNQLE